MFWHNKLEWNRRNPKPALAWWTQQRTGTASGAQRCVVMLLQMAASFHKSYHPTNHIFWPMSFGDQNLITILETQIIISTGLWSNHSTNPLRLSTCLSTCLSTSLYIIPSSTSLNKKSRNNRSLNISSLNISSGLQRSSGACCKPRIYSPTTQSSWQHLPIKSIHQHFGRNTKTVHSSVPTLTLLGLQILISPMSNWTLVAVKDTLRIKICTIVLYRIVLYCIVLYCIVLYCIVWLDMTTYDEVSHIILGRTLFWQFQMLANKQSKSCEGPVVASQALNNSQHLSTRFLTSWFLRIQSKKCNNRKQTFHDVCEGPLVVGSVNCS